MASPEQQPEVSGHKHHDTLYLRGDTFVWELLSVQHEWVFPDFVSAGKAFGLAPCTLCPKHAYACEVRPDQDQVKLFETLSFVKFNDAGC